MSLVPLRSSIVRSLVGVVAIGGLLIAGAPLALADVLPTPTPAATATAVPTAAAVPTETTVPVETAAPTETSAPTATPSVTPAPTVTPAPQQAQKPAPAPAPAEAPATDVVRELQAPVSPDDAQSRWNPLRSGAFLEGGQKITSAETNPAYTFIFQTDGNAVIYRADGRVMWNTQTTAAGGRLVMQRDGNVVIYTRTGTPVWQSGTSANPDSELVIQEDGNLVTYRPDDSASWSIQAGLVPAGTYGGVAAGTYLPTRGSFLSPDGRFRFVMQDDGNAVYYGPNGAIWSTGTSGAGNRLAVQTDGNIVVYSASDRALWASGSRGTGVFLISQRDGNLVAYNGAEQAVWTINYIYSSDTLRANEALYSGESLVSANGAHRFVMQADGNLVLYSNGRSVWASGTANPGSSFTVRPDGRLTIQRGVWPELTIYGSLFYPVGISDPRLAVQNDGNVVLYSSNRGPAWSTTTGPLIFPRTLR